MISSFLLTVIPSALFVGYAIAVPAPSSTPLGGAGVVPNDWQQKKCTDQYINDAGAPPTERWNAAAAAHAWTSVELAWNQEGLPAGDVPLNLSAYMGNYFHTNDKWECENLANNPCDNTIKCTDVTPNYPAGFLLMNSFHLIHSVHKATYDALGTALPLMQGHISTFQNTFAPSIADDDAIIKEILDVFSLIFAVGSAYVWNVVAKEAQWFTDDNYRGFSKDSANAMIALGINSGKDNLPSTSYDIAGKLSDVLATWFGDWEQAQADYLYNTFRGSSSSLTALSGMMNSGMALSINTPDQNALSNEIQHIMWAKMVPVAWNLAPGKFTPFILKTSDPCSSTAQGDVSGLMDDDTAAKTHVCYDGYTFYVVNPTWENNRGILFNVKLEALPGGTWDNMQNPVWMGLALDDFVISSWEGYKKNGNKNGYTPTADSQDTDSDNILFGNGVQTPGFASLPLCDLAEMKQNLATHDYDSRPPMFPCNQ